MNNAALVLGGYVNGYSIVKELTEEGVSNIALFDYGRSVAGYSNKINYHARIDKTPGSLLHALKELNKQFDYIVIFPTDDLQVENLSLIRHEIEHFCFVPLNPVTVMQSFDKYYQYAVCEKIGIPYPKTVQIKEQKDLERVSELVFPVLIKPSTRVDAVINIFRNMYIESLADFEKNKHTFVDFLCDGVEFIVSEFVPGDDTNIYAYTCFRSPDGDIQNEWVGKKLTQYPDNYGVFCSSSNEASDEVLKQGRALVTALDAFGVVEPEFKYDCRDKKYKLMEVNLRSMMWNRTGKISGVRLHKSMYDYATNQEVVVDIQNRDVVIHFVYMMHEIGNLISRKGYWRHFKHNVWGGDKRVWAIYESSDIKPFVYSFYLLTRAVVSACLKRLKIR
ncbi:hypothetical protein DHB74_00370 [Pseudomonas sp. G11-1]|nr:hypothetical protein [Pseudomonas sp. G11-1]MCO5789092.1 hypothetical protein [Pseudomonas sp. G11-2]